MKGPKVIFVCRECGATSPKWLGKCPECEAWVPFDEVVKMIMENKIPDAKTQTAVLKAKILLGL